MIAPWELILHHTYAGTPGVIIDHSPGRGSHGVAMGLDPGDVVFDGAAPGSGAIDFSRRHQWIEVQLGHGWDRLGGFHAEVIFRCGRPNSSGFLFNGDGSFFGSVFNGDEIDFGFFGTSGLHRFHVRFGDFGIDPRAWTTAGVAHDGLAAVALFLNGRPVKTWQDTPLQPLRHVQGLTIGAERGGSLGFEGLIDDVKIWRPNPAYVDGTFTGHAVTDGLTDCWAKWGVAVRDVLDEIAADDPECLPRIVRLIDEVRSATLASGIAHSSAARTAWEQAATQYRRLWAQGRLAAIGPVLQQLRAALAQAGVDVDGAVDILFRDPCFRNLLERIPLPDCDEQFIDMLKAQVS